MILLLILHLGQVIKLNRLAHLEKSEVPFFLLSLELEEWKVDQIFFFSDFGKLYGDPCAELRILHSIIPFIYSI